MAAPVSTPVFASGGPASGAPLPTKTAVFTPAKLAQLAADDANQVYDYVYDTPARVLPPREVRLKLLAIRGVVVAQAREHPEWKWRDHKRHLAAAHPDLADMARTHPKMYAVASHPGIDYARDFAPILVEIDLYQRVLDGRMTRKEATVAVTQSLQRHFLLPEGKTKEDTTPWGVSERPDA